MNRRKFARLAVASVTVGLSGMAIKKTYDQLGEDRPPVDEDLLRKVLVGAALFSGLALVTASL